MLLPGTADREYHWEQRPVRSSWYACFKWVPTNNQRLGASLWIIEKLPKSGCCCDKLKILVRQWHDGCIGHWIGFPSPTWMWGILLGRGNLEKSRIRVAPSISSLCREWTSHNLNQNWGSGCYQIVSVSGNLSGSSCMWIYRTTKNCWLRWHNETPMMSTRASWWDQAMVAKQWFDGSKNPFLWITTDRIMMSSEASRFAVLSIKIEGLSSWGWRHGGRRIQQDDVFMFLLKLGDQSHSKKEQKLFQRDNSPQRIWYTTTGRAMNTQASGSRI